MRLRAPAVPLITIDPYFSVWSESEKLTDVTTTHWTGRPNTLLGYADIDGERYRFMGKDDDTPAMTQTRLDVTALSTTYTFTAAVIEMTAIFTSPLLPSDVDLMSRPVSYLEVVTTPTDGEEHAVTLTLLASEELCLDRKGQLEVVTETTATKYGLPLCKMGSKDQPVLGRDGDDVRIDWGYFYMGAADGEPSFETRDGMTFACVTVPTDGDTLFLLAYDAVKDIEYFGQHLDAVWRRDGKDILSAIDDAEEQYFDLVSDCETFSDRLFCQAVRAGGEQYAEILELAYRQSVAAHKAVLDPNGELLWISKECYSNGCAATVDVSYPSIPLYLLYNPELVKGMMRPIISFAESDAWVYDFAPHDCGRYHKVNGERYAKNNPDGEMPVEECGNMLVMAAAVTVAEGDASFAMEHIDLFETWVRYLIENGDDPANQLCTDDFAGHMAHNCNLSVKAVMGIAGLGIIHKYAGNTDKYEQYIAIARRMAEGWVRRAMNPDGSFRLAFDREGSWSMKYNMVWDKLFGTNLFPAWVYASENAANLRHRAPFGLPLDVRSAYTKSDWLVWTATLAPDRTDFETFVGDLWRAYNVMPERVPLTDWYWANSSNQVVYHRIPADQHPVGFRNRTVIGGVFIKLLEYTGKMIVR